MTPPAVSVVMPVRDAARYLYEAIESILCQTFEDFELLVVDDGSSDASPEILGAFQSRDPRVRVRQRQPEGLVAALNHGCSLARGQFIARMDADDVASAERLERQIEFFADHPEVALLGTGHTEIDDEGTVLGTTVYPTDVEAVSSRLLTKNCIAHPTVMFSRAVFEQVGGYRSAVVQAEDYDLWLRFGDRHAIANLEQPLLAYRMHPASVSVNNRRQQVLSTLAAQAATRARRAGGDDPLASVAVVTLDVLEGLGVSRSDVTRAVFAALCGEAEWALASGHDALALQFCDEALAGEPEMALTRQERAHVHRMAAIAAMNQRLPIRSVRAVAAGIVARPTLAMGVLRHLARRTTAFLAAG
jgi:glycosyltransferase involved in cell wall biosynthesis